MSERVVTAEDLELAEFERGVAYHGSIVEGIRTLNPARARNGDSQDERASVYADTDIDYAVFMALIGGRGLGGWRRQPNDNKMSFYVYEDAAEMVASRSADQLTGAVYVVARHNFTENRGGTLRSFKPVPVLGEIAVRGSDMTCIPYVVVSRSTRRLQLERQSER